MANISQYLADIMAAVYGEDVRGSIHDAIEIINDVSEVVLTTGTAVTGPTSSSTGFYDDSLYLNTNTMELWKCIGTNLWQSQGVLKGNPGAAGVGISSIDLTSSVGLVDTYTITYTDSNTTTFTVTNGQDGTDGENGNKWYRGTAISGKDVNPTVFSGSGITYAYPNDFYLNPNEGAVYHCVSGGDALTATWSYDFTMTGGGGGGTSDYNDLTNKPKINSVELSGSKSLSDLGIQGALTAGNGIDITGSTISIDPGSIASGVQKPVTGDAVNTALSGKANSSHTHAASDITSGLATVATSGSYADLSTKADLNGLTDVTLTTPSQDQVLKYDGSKWVNAAAPSGGHTMISNSGYETTMATHALDSTDDDVASAYVIANWSNCDAKLVLTTASQGDDGIGTWADTGWESGTRSGWLWSKELYNVLSDNSVEITPVFDVGNNEAVSLYAMRIDDNVSQTIGGVSTNGGAVAFKFNGTVQNASGIKVGVKLVKQRTEVDDTGHIIS